MSEAASVSEVVPASGAPASGASASGASVSGAGSAIGGPGRWARIRVRPGTVVGWVLVLVALGLPFVLDVSLLQIGLFSYSAIIGAIGLNLLSGTTGQLSLGHAFFVAVGAYAYAWFGGETGRLGVAEVTGLSLHPVLAAVLAVLAAGVAGLLFSPISRRLRGIYLGVASIGLVFIGQYVWLKAEPVTGGVNGRNIPEMSVPGFTFTDENPPLWVLGHYFGQFERLWYLSLGLAVVAYLFARNLLRGRVGRALEAVRDGETAAAAMGVDVPRYKTVAFVLSSMYAGLAGVVYALAFSRIVPESFGFQLSIDYLAMIVIGGLGSVPGAAVGAVFVTALPLLLSRYSADLPFLAQPGGTGVDPSTFARYVYGALIVAVVLVQPGGLADLGRRLTLLRRSRTASARDNDAPTTVPEGREGN